MPRGRPRRQGRQHRGGASSHAEPSSSPSNATNSNSNSEVVEQPPVPVPQPNLPVQQPPVPVPHSIPREPPEPVPHLDQPVEQPPMAVLQPNFPVQPPLLNLQATHRSETIITGHQSPSLTARHHVVKQIWHPRYKPYLIRAGLYGVQQMGHIPSDARLITAWVERWREETHTFHLPVGEVTVTLEDVAVLLGLPVDGRPLVGRTDLVWSNVVRGLLGVPVTARTFKRRSRTNMKLGWLDDNFHRLPDDADEDKVQCYARAYMLALVGSVLFTDHSGDCVSVIYLPFFEDFDEAGKYSWGSAVLAYLYRELCLATSLKRKQIGGSLLLLQIWSWERFPFGRPQPRNEEPELGGDEIEARPPYGFKWSGHHEFAEHVTCRLTEGYRDDIDRFTDDSKVNWRPYEQEKHLLPPICTNNSELWMTTSPLIHFWIVEMYNPERVMRQFGLYQSFPPFLRDTKRSLHKMKHANCCDWRAKIDEYLTQWDQRRDNLVMEDIPYDPSTFNNYKWWLSSSSILCLQTSLMRSADQPWIHPRMLHYQQIVPNMQSAAEKIWELTRGAAQLLGDWDEGGAKAFLRSVLSVGKSALKDLGEFTALNDTFNALDEVNEAEGGMEEDVAEAASIGSDHDDVPESATVGGGEDVPEDTSVEYGEDVPDGASVGGDDMSHGFTDDAFNEPEHGAETEQARPIPVPEGNRRARYDEAGPSRPPPKRGRVYRGG